MLAALILLTLLSVVTLAVREAQHQRTVAEVALNAFDQLAAASARESLERQQILAAALAERQGLLRAEADQRLELLTRIQHPSVVLPPPRLIDDAPAEPAKPDEWGLVGDIAPTLPEEDADLREAIPA